MTHRGARQLCCILICEETDACLDNLKEEVYGVDRADV